MNLRIVIVSILLLPLSLAAQKKEKPRLLVYGSDISAYAAAAQASLSSVPTVWLLDQPTIAPEISTQTVQIKGSQYMDAGAWLEILMQLANVKTKNDSLIQAAKRDMNPQLVQNAIEKILRERKGLTIIKDQPIQKFQRKKKTWNIQLGNGAQYDVHAVIDFSPEGSLYAQAKEDPKAYASEKLTKAKDLTLALSRTSLAAGTLQDEVQVLLLKDLLTFERVNLFDAGFLRQMDQNPENIPFRAAYGQALGATAGYLAFFKTSSKQIDIRKLQSELLAFSARISPYQDVSASNQHYVAIQKNYLAGIFLGKEEAGKYLFKADDIVRFEEIKPVMNDIYTRSQLWFLDNYRNEDLSWGDLFSLIKYVSLKGDEVQQQVEKDWSKKLKFEGEFNLQNKVSRQQFAVIASLYSNSFAKAINIDGTFVK